MSKEFNLTASVTISLYTVVEAETLEAAIEIAQDRSIEAARWNDKIQPTLVWVADEYDGEPTDIKEN